MKKMTAAIALCVILAACAKSEPPPPVPNTPETPPPAETAASSSETAAPPIISEADKKYIITGAYGETLDLREADKIYTPKWNEELGDSEKIALTADEAVDASYCVVEFNSFCYAAKPSGVFYSTIDNPDMFEYEDGRPRFKQEIQHEYKFERVNVGETCSGLTVKEANYIISVQNGSINELVYSGMFYEGEITMSGYATCAIMSGGYLTAGNIYFYPENSPNIPDIVNPRASLGLQWLVNDIDNFEDCTWFYTDGSFENLGSAFDEKYKGLDIPTDGSVFRVTATIRNLNPGCSDANYVPERTGKSEVIKISLD